MALDRPPLRIGILLLVFATFYADARECKIACSGPTSPFNLQVGKAYQYELQGVSTISLPGAKDKVSQSKITAKAEVVVGANCEHVITLMGVKTSGTDGNEISLDKVMGSHPSKFSLQNGKLEELCTEPDESIPAVNIKRAIISYLQTSLVKDSGSATITENDVFGSCPTNLDFSKSGDSLTVRKSRDLNRCAYRENLVFPVFTSTYHASSDIQSSQFLDGSSKIEQNFEKGVLKNAHSEEKYIFTPLSTPEAETKIEVKTSIKLIGTSAKACPSVANAIPKPLFYQPEHEHEVKGFAPEVANLLKKACENPVIDKDGAKNFGILVKSLSASPKDEIIAVYNQVKAGAGFKDKDLARTLLIDAIVSSFSASGAEALAELLKSNEISQKKHPGLLLKLGFVKHASRGALKAAIQLLDDNSPPLAYLGLGMLGGKFCRGHNCDKFGSQEVEAFQKKLAEPLLVKGCKPSNQREEDTLVASLKGLANMNFLTKPVADKLAEYSTDKSIKPRIRAAILDTMKSDAHKPQIKEAATKLFKCQKTDSELRIKAYQVLLQCPCGAVAETVKEVLNDPKTSNQVGSYVVSSLRNIRASTSPFKESAKHYLGNIVSQRRYPFDIRKYSQTGELSYNLDLVNLGASAESSVIYSQKSWVPRVLNFNLTTEAYGHAFNAFELEARIENLDRVIEHVIGPKGFLKTHSTNEVIEKNTQFLNTLLEKIASRYDKALRPKRSTTWDQLTALAKQVNLNLNAEENLNIDLSLKYYGAEVGWVTIHAGDTKIKPEKIVDELFGALDDAISKAKNIDTDYRRSFVFLDSEIVYPTSLGLGLKVHHTGTEAFRVKADGKIDIPAILKDPKNADLKFQLVPSVSINLGTALSIDGIVVESGVHISGTVHSSTGSDITVRLLDGHGVDVKLGLPIPKQELLSLSNEIVSFTKEDTKPLAVKNVVFDVTRSNYQGCFDQLSPILGLTFCGELSVPWDGTRSLSPAFGPSRLSVIIDKEDETLMTYHFKVYELVKEGAANFELLFDTPNSKGDRKVAVTFEGALKPKIYAKANLISPWTGASLDGAFIETANELALQVKIKHDSAEYNLKAGATRSKNGNQYNFQPIFEYKAPEIKSSLIGRRGGAKSPQQSITASGLIVVDVNEQPYSRKWTFKDLSLNTPRGKYLIEGSGSLNANGIDSNTKLSFNEDSISVKLQALAKGEYDRSLWLAFASKAYPDAGIDLKWDFSKKGELPKKFSLENKMSLVHGPDPNSKDSRISWNTKLDRDSSSQTASGETKVAYPVLNLDGSGSFSFSPNSGSVGVKGQFDKYSGELKGSLDVNKKKDGEYQLEALAELMGKSVVIHSSRKIPKNSQSKLSNAIEFKPGGKYEANALVTHKFNDKDVDFHIDGEIKLPAEPKSIKLNTGIMVSTSESKANLKAIAGSKTLIEAESSLKKGDKPTGHFKIKIPQYLDSAGDFTYDGSHLKASASVDAPKVERKMEAKADLTYVKEKKLNGAVDFCWDTKNPSKSIKIQTDTLLGDSSVDTKNSITYENSKTQFNGKAKMAGKKEVGSTAAEAELILPDGLKVAAKVSHTHDYSDKENLNGEILGDLSIVEPGKEPRKVSLKLAGKNVHLEEMKFDGQGTLTYLSPEKKDANVHVHLKKVPKDKEKWTIKGEVGASGSAIPRPLTVKLDSDVSNDIINGQLLKNPSIPPVTYHLQVISGNDFSVESNGKIGGNTIAGDFSGKFPEKSAVKNFKWITSNVVDLGKHPKVKSNNNIQWNSNKFIKAEVEGSCEDNGINYGAEWETDEIKKRKLSGSAHWNTGEAVKGDVSANLVWEGKTADLSVKVDSNKEKNAGSIHVIANTPTGKTDIMLKNKIVKEGQGLHTDLQITSGDKKISASSKIEADKDHPLLEVNVDHPDGKSKLLVKGDHKGERHWSHEVKAKWSNNGGHFNYDNEFDLASIDNFFVKANLDAPKISKEKLHIDISNKPGKDDGKKITINVKSGDKVKMAGSLNYAVKEEGGVMMVEGSGNVKYEDKSHPVNFKAIHQKLDNGVLVSLDVKSGKKSLSWKHKQTPTEFIVERTLCKETGECSKGVISNVIKTANIDEYEQHIEVILDTSLIFEDLDDLTYKATIKRNGLLQDQTAEFQWGPNEKIKYNSYVHEKQAGVILALPKRTVGAEVSFDHNKKDNGIGIKFEADLWLNKEKNDKLCLISIADVQKSQDSYVATGETKLTHPSLKKDLVIKGKATLNGKKDKVSEGELIVDVLKSPQDKIVITYKNAVSMTGPSYSGHFLTHVKSEGCKLDLGYEEKFAFNTEQGQVSWSESSFYSNAKGSKREASASLELSPKKAFASVKIPDVTLFEISNQIERKDKQLNSGGHGVFLGKKIKSNWVYNIETHVVNGQLTSGSKSVEIEAGAALGKKGILRLSVDKKNCGQLDVALDEANFLKSTYNYDADALKSLWHGVADSIIEMSKEAEKSLKGVLDEDRSEIMRLAECFAKCLPDFKGVGEHLKHQLEELKNELNTDKVINVLGKELKKAMGKASDQAAAIGQAIIEFLTTIGELAQQVIQQSIAIGKELSGQFAEIAKTAAEMSLQIMESALKVAVKVSDAILDEIKKHDSDIKKYLQIVSDIVFEFGKQISQIVFVVNDELKKTYDLIAEQMKDFPVFAVIKEKMDELKEWQVPEEVWTVYKEVLENVKSILPTPECEDFVTAASDFLIKVLKHEKFDYDKAGKELYSKMEAAIRSLIKKFSENVPSQSPWKPGKYVQLPTTKWLRIPTGGLRVNILAWLLSWDQPTLPELIRTYAPSLTHPLDNFPPFTGRGSIVGNQIITFDGSLLEAGGSCSYILVEDYKDRNFSLSAHFKDNAIASLTLADGTDVITIKPKAQPTLNGVPTDFPVIGAKGLMAWYRPDSIGAASRWGVKAICSKDLVSCLVELNGFYFNRVRGLLGNMNNEQFDDLLTPKGDLAKDASELSNAWKTDPACAAAPPQHTDARQPECTELFTDNIEILFGWPYAKMSTWRTLCDRFLAHSKGDKHEAACTVARAFTHAAQEKGGLFLRSPDKCAICHLKDKTVGQLSLEEVMPEKAADIVIIISTNENNKDTYTSYVKPVVRELKSELASKGFSDVQIGLVSYHPDMPYTAFHTSLGSPNFNGEDANIKFIKRKVYSNATLGHRLEMLAENIASELGESSRGNAIREVLEWYNFRPYALTGILSVSWEPCVRGSVPNIIPPIRIFGSTVGLGIRNIVLSLATPIESIEVDSKQKVDSGEVAGIGEDQVYTTGGKVINEEAETEFDFCVLGSQISGGVGVPLNNFKKAQQAGKGPQFIKSSAKAIVEKLIASKQQLECRCDLLRGIIPRTRCYEDQTV